MISFKDVYKTYPNGFTALKGINLQIEQGEFVAIIGLSGAGKSTILRCINRMHDITKGELTVDGVDVDALKGKTLRRYRRKVGMIFQSFNLVSRSTAIKNVLTADVPDMNFFRVLFGIFTKDQKMRALESLDKVGILDKAYTRCDQLSGGQQQRVALARALVVEPGVLLFDEPLSNLDAKLRVSMRTEIRRIQQKAGITAVYVTHDQSEAMSISDKIIIMNAGKIAQMGTPHEIYYHPVNEFVADFIGDANFLKGKLVRHEENVDVVEVYGKKVKVESTGDRLAVGADTTIVLRPESTVLCDEGVLPCEVIVSTFMGAYQLYHVMVGDTKLIIHEYNPKGKKIYNVGDKAGIYFEPDNAHAL